MKRTFTSLVLGGALLVGGDSVGLAQDFDAGVAAYERGDYATAHRHWIFLAKQGDQQAQYAVGRMYDMGRGVAQDYKEAVRWFRRSAVQGNALAQNALGQYYSSGTGVVQDDTVATSWYRASAENGFWAGQLNLGSAYENGRGVAQDYVYAHMWFNISESLQSSVTISLRDRIATKLTAAQVAKAQELARQCVSRNYKGC